MIQTILEVVQICFMLVGVCVAVYGVGSWRREHRGKRRAELAEETLVLFYEARDAIAAIRHPISSDAELAHIKKYDGEPATTFEARRSASIVFERYKNHSDLFSKIHSMRYRFMSIIGKEQAKPFEDLRQVLNEIFTSARMLARLWPRNHFRNIEQEQKHFDRIQEQEDIFWDTGSEDDPIEAKLSKILSEIEATCKKAIEGGSGNLLGRFKRERLTKS